MTRSRTAAVHLGPHLAPSEQAAGLQALGALTALGFDVIGWVDPTEHSANWSLPFRGAFPSVVYACPRPDSADLYFEPGSVGWPGWRTAIAQVYAESIGVPKELQPACRCDEKSANMREAAQHARSAQRHLATADSAENAGRAALKHASERLLALRRALDDLPTATPDIVEELMMEDVAGRLFPLREHQRFLTILDEIIQQVARMQLGGGNPPLQRDLALILQYLNPKGPFDGSEAKQEG